MMIDLSRRGLLTGLFAAIAAPAIVRIDSIMPVRAVIIQPSSGHPVHPIEVRYPGEIILGGWAIASAHGGSGPMDLAYWVEKLGLG